MKHAWKTPWGGRHLSRKAAGIVAAVALLGGLAGVGGLAIAQDQDTQADPSEPQSQAAPATDAQSQAAQEQAKALRPASNGDTSAAAVDPGTDLGAPSHHKYVKDNGDGTYWLTLDVTGASKASTEEKHQPADVVLVMDSSGSMDECASGSGWGCDTRWDVATKDVTTLAQSLLTDANAALPADQQVQLSVIDFDTTSRIMNLGNGQWTTSASDVTNSFRSMDVDGGTNWEAALSDANSLNTNRAGAQKYIVFISDGAPTFRNSSMGTSCSGWFPSSECAYYGQGIYGTGSSDPGDRNFTAAVTAASQRNGATLYAVSTGSEANDKMRQFADEITPKGTFFDGTDDVKLSAAFQTIIQQITTQASYQDVLIKDTLSGWAVATTNAPGGSGYITNYSARDVNGGDVTLTDPAASKAHVTYDQQTKALSLNFDAGTKLSPNVTYQVSLLIKPSDEAYQHIIANNGYPNTGEANTDAEGNSTSSNQPGFFSNADNTDGSTTANVYYHKVTQVEGQDPVVGPEEQSSYPRPVIQVNVPSLTLVKGVDNANAGKLGATPADWKLSALKGASGIQPTNPSGEATTEGSTVRQSVATTKLAPGVYTLAEAADQAANDYRHFGGYTAGDWACVDANGKQVAVNANAQNGSQSVNLTQGTDVTCTVINTAKPGAIAWQKVDSANTDKTLPGSAWTLAAKDAATAGFTTKNVADDGENDAAANSQGNLRADNLKWGDYTLTEATPPNGYAKSDKTYDVSVLPPAAADANPDFTVNPTGTDNGKITNTMITVSSLPLTGGVTGRDWLIVGGGLTGAAALALAALGIYRRRKALSL